MVPFLQLESVETAPRTRRRHHTLEFPVWGPGTQDIRMVFKGRRAFPWAQSGLRAGQLCVAPFALRKPAGGLRS